MNPIFHITRESLKAIRDESRDLNDSMQEMERKLTRYVLEHKEALLTAWVAETGLLPSESVIVIDHSGRIFVESKTKNDKRVRVTGAGE